MLLAYLSNIERKLSQLYLTVHFDSSWAQKSLSLHWSQIDRVTNEVDGKP